MLSRKLKVMWYYLIFNNCKYSLFYVKIQLVKIVLTGPYILRTIGNKKEFSIQNIVNELNFETDSFGVCE